MSWAGYLALMFLWEAGAVIWLIVWARTGNKINILVSVVYGLLAIWFAWLALSTAVSTS